MGSRDVTNYSLLHCASIFADARALNTLIKAGSIFFQSYHFTPLNVSLLLYYRRQLDEILKIKIIPKVGYRFRLSGGSRLEPQVQYRGAIKKSSSATLSHII